MRAPGGIAYLGNRETHRFGDVRGDMQSPASIAAIAFSVRLDGRAHSAATSPSGTITQKCAPAPAGSPDESSAACKRRSGIRGDKLRNRQSLFGDATRLLRSANVAQHHRLAYEAKARHLVRQRPAAVIIDCSDSKSGRRERSASVPSAVLAALPAIEAQFPGVTFKLLNVQADYTEQQLFGVLQTLLEGIVFTGITMLFFLHSWRNAVVVMIAIPASLFVTLFIMKLVGFTIDTVSLLAMTLTIGILVDDSIVVLENIERHYENAQTPKEAAILGRTRTKRDRCRSDGDYARRRGRCSCPSRFRRGRRAVFSRSSAS